MLSVTVHKDIAEYQPKVVGKMTMRTLISIVGALGSSVFAGIYMYFVLGWNVGDHIMIIYAISLPFWLCGFVRPKGMKFEKFLPLWLKAQLTNDHIFYVPSMYLSGFANNPAQPMNTKGKVYEKFYRKQRNLNGIEAYSPRAGKVIR